MVIEAIVSVPSGLGGGQFGGELGPLFPKLRRRLGEYVVEQGKRVGRRVGVHAGAQFGGVLLGLGVGAVRDLIGQQAAVTQVRGQAAERVGGAPGFDLVLFAVAGGIVRVR